MPRTFNIKYDIHCRFENHFGKEMIVKNCVDESHAKNKLHEYWKKRIGVELEFISYNSIQEIPVSDKDLSSSVGSIFDDIFDNDVMSSLLKGSNNKQHKKNKYDRYH